MLSPGRLVTVLALVGFLAAPAGARLSTPAVTPQITMNLNAANYLEVVLASGTSIRAGSAGATIAPGHYQVIVNDDVPDLVDGVHLFRLSGPGVDIQTDMAAGDSKTEAYDAVFAPNSTYVLQDDRQPGLGRVVFTTSAAVAGTSSTSSTQTSTGSSGSSSNSSVIGSKTAAATFRGKLGGAVTSKGQISLVRNGKAVTTLRSGRYSIDVDDRGPTTGFTLQQVTKRPITLTGANFLGHHSVTVGLSAGQWVYYSGPGAKKHFIVVS